MDTPIMEVYKASGNSNMAEALKAKAASRLLDAAIAFNRHFLEGSVTAKEREDLASATVFAVVSGIPTKERLIPEV